MAIQTEVIASAKSLESHGWDELLSPSDFYLSSEWLSAVELGEGTRGRYFLARSASKMLATISVQEVDGTTHLAFRPDEAVRQLLVARGCENLNLEGLSRALLPSSVCGGRHLGTSLVPVRNNLLRTAKYDAISQLVHDSLDCAAASEHMSATYLSVDSDDAELRRALEAVGFMGMKHHVHSVLNLPPGGFEAYLGCLSSRWRMTARSDRRKVARAGYTFQVRALTPEMAVAIAPLEANLNSKYGDVTDIVALADYNSQYLAHLKRPMRVILALDDHGSIHGFCTFIDWQGHAFARSWGCHPDVPQGVPLYFSTVYYELIDWCYENNLQAIDYATGAMPAKKSRGCAQRQKYMYIRPLTASTSPDVRRLLLDLAVEK